MSLKRTPLPAHDWPDEGVVRECPDCGSTWDTRQYDDPPPWPCKREPLDRSKGLSPVSETNSGREHQKDEAYREWVRHQPCVACRREGVSDPHHVRSRGSGHGDWLSDGTGNLVPLCRSCHRFYHQRGHETFEDVTGTDLSEAARRTGEAYREEQTDD